MAQVSKVKCSQCGVRVANDWSAKWKHIVHWHPEILASHLLPLIANPLEAHAFGVGLGNWFKRGVARGLASPKLQ